MSKSPGRILYELRESRRELYEPLREYIEWLLSQRKSRRLQAFKDELENVKNCLAGKVESGEVTESEASIQKADWVWWAALDVTRDTETFMIIKTMLEKDLLPAVKDELPTDTRTLDEVTREVTENMVAKLEELLNRSPR